MSGGKGGSTTQQVQIPQWLSAAAQKNLAKGDEVAKLGYVPYYGPDIAALNPSQIGAMQNTVNQASAFGMAPKYDVRSNLPQAQEFAGGMQGYSSAPLYEQAVAELASRRPGQAAAINNMFLDPYNAPMQYQARPTQGMNIISTPMVYGGYDLGPDIEEALRMADEANYAPQVAVAPRPAPIAPTSVVDPARPKPKYSDFFRY